MGLGRPKSDESEKPSREHNLRVASPDDEGPRPIPHKMLEQLRWASPIFGPREDAEGNKYPRPIRLLLLLGIPLILWAAIFRMMGLL